MFNLFFGGSGVGKSHIMLYTAKVLVNAGYKVLAVDTTQSCSSWTFFNLKDIEFNETLSLFGMDLIIINPESKNKLEIIEKVKYENYDFVLVEADDTMVPKMFSMAKNRFLVQDFDVKNLHINKKLMENLFKNIGLNETHILFNNSLKSKVNAAFLEKSLGVNGGKRIQLPFSMVDYTADKDNKMEGRIILKNMTDVHNVAIFDICNIITENALLVDKKTFVKLIKK